MGTIGWRRTAGAVALMAVTGMASACGGDSGDEAGERVGEQLAEKAMEDSGAEGVDVDVDGEEVTIESDEGTIKVGTGEVPENFPEGLSVVDGDVVSSIDTPEGSSVTLDVDDATGAFDEAIADLEANGWTREQLTEAGETRLGTFSKDGQTAMVMSDTTSGQLTYTIAAG